MLSIRPAQPCGVSLRAVSRAAMLAVAALVAVPQSAAPQAAVTIVAGAAPSQKVAPSGRLVVPVVVDMSAASGGSLGTLTTSIAWNPAFLTLDSLIGAGFGVVTPNLANATAGNATFSLNSATATTTTVTAANLYFSAGPTLGGTRVSLSTTAAGNPIGQINLGQLLARNMDVCIAPPGTWGDANGDATVDIIDAQQIARASVGLSVANAAAVAGLGDVNADGAVDIIDAQQVARYVVSLPASPRVNTSLAPTPVVASLAVSRATTSIAVGAATAISATPKDASGYSLEGCSAITWASSDVTKVVVNPSGMIRGVSAGVANVTATSGAQTAQVAVTVTRPDTLSALLHLRNSTAGGTAGTSNNDGIWLLSGLVTDEWKSSDTFSQRNNADQRAVIDFDGLVQTNLSELYKARSDARGALPALFAASAFPATIGQMYFVMGYVETLLAETFCNGVPLDDASSGLVVGGPMISNATLFTRSLAHFDSALSYSTALDPASVSINNSSRVAKARALVGLGQFSAAVALVASVPTSFRNQSTLIGSESNRIWSYNNSVHRYTVGDSFDLTGTITNALPFASAADPRVPVNGTSTGTSSAGKGFDQSTNLVTQSIWAQTNATPLLSGIDARLIEAEAKLNSGDSTGMLSILNALRAAPQDLGGITTPTMAALTLAGTQQAAVDQFFREKAFWTFSRGQRLGDLRRLMRLYGRAESGVFPTGPFFKGGSYGNTINLPVSVGEGGNVLSAVCTDRNP